MTENPAHFVIQACFRPIGMLMAQGRRFHFTRRPVKLFGQREATFRSHPAVNRELFGTGLLIRQHEKRMRQKRNSRKRVCDGNEISLRGQFQKFIKRWRIHDELRMKRQTICGNLFLD
jgi:hypothetical protein